MQQTVGGDYVVAGKTDSFSKGDDDLLITMFSSNGEINECIGMIGTVNWSVESISLSSQELTSTVQSTEADITIPDISPKESTATINEICPWSDSDLDGVHNLIDNCLEIANGPDLGTCMRYFNGVFKNTGVTCTSDNECGSGESCDTYQIDYNSNDIGDACECYADFDGDSNVYPSDVSIFLGEYGRTDCITNPPCQADIDGDGNVYPSDLSIFLAEYGSTDCPTMP